MDIYKLFEAWRLITNPKNSRGLAWFLANEFCKRFYASHGIIPYIIAHGGLGYYGIQLQSVSCAVNTRIVKYGRMTIGGNVENWRTGGPGDHGLPAIQMCIDGISSDEIIHRAIEYMGIEPIPQKSHYHCRHKRWGGSFELCFEIAAFLAIQLEQEGIQIWNHPDHTQRLLQKLDPQVDQKEHLGAFLFKMNDEQILLAADGRLLDGSGDNIWFMYMNGYSLPYLATHIKNKLNV